MYLLIPVTLLIMTRAFSKAILETKSWPLKEAEDIKTEKESHNRSSKQFVKRQALIDESLSSTTLSAERLDASSPCTVYYCLAGPVSLVSKKYNRHHAG